MTAAVVGVGTERAQARATATVAICVATCFRPVGLARLIDSLAALRFTKNRPEDVALQLIVIDNDREGSARAVVEAAVGRLPWPVRYAIEPERGISHARNRSIALAAGCDFVAFVDDDNVVAPAWLDELLAAQRAFGADMVVGTVDNIFDAEPPRWVVDGGFFDRARHPTGTALPFASLPNALIRRSILDRVAGPFDPRFALTGAEDTFLLAQLVRGGARLVWCDEARVSEVVPASRVSARWILQRAYRIGNSSTICDKVLDPTPRRRAILLAKGGGRIAQGLAGLPLALVRGRAELVRTLGAVAKGTGRLAGVLGYRFEEYRRVHGA